MDAGLETNTGSLAPGVETPGYCQGVPTGREDSRVNPIQLPSFLLRRSHRLRCLVHSLDSQHSFDQPPVGADQIAADQFGPLPQLATIAD